jgi:hypothetical protein
MPVVWRWLAALLSCAPDMLCVAYAWLVHGAVVPRDVYRLKRQETQSRMGTIIRLKPLG